MGVVLAVHKSWQKSKRGKELLKKSIMNDLELLLKEEVTLLTPTRLTFLQQMMILSERPPTSRKSLKSENNWT